jgi:hypothetical protein
MGTALIGFLLLPGIFGGLTTAIDESSISGNMTTYQINPVINFVEKMQTRSPQDIHPSMGPEATHILDSS